MQGRGGGGAGRGGVQAGGGVQVLGLHRQILAPVLCALVAPYCIQIIKRTAPPRKVSSIEQTAYSYKRMQFEMAQPT